MTDDIVSRLRKQWNGEFDPTGKMLSEAADEIERLRAEVVRLGSFIHPIGTVIGREAVRGE